jgi:hypothetical protein
MAIPSYNRIAAEIARKRHFGLVLDHPPEDINAGRHVFINPSRDGLLADAIAWFNEVPGPSTAKYVEALTLYITPLKRGQTAHLIITRAH